MSAAFAALVLLSAATPERAPISAAAGLDAAIRQAGRSGAEWVVYAVPAAGRVRSCCFDARPLRERCCHLDGGHSVEVLAATPPLLGAHEVRVFLRLQGARPVEVRLYSADCPVDPGATRVAWLEDVKVTDSLALMKSLVGALPDEATAAIAQHDDPSVDAVLVGLARDGTSVELRGQALFWLAERASRKAVGEVERAIEQDPETEVKKLAVDALQEMPDGAGVPILIDLARRHKNPAVRAEAFSELGESEDPRALAFFEEVLLR
jgi:HEAT repeats